MDVVALASLVGDKVHLDLFALASSDSLERVENLYAVAGVHVRRRILGSGSRAARNNPETPPRCRVRRSNAGAAQGQEAAYRSTLGL